MAAPPPRGLSLYDNLHDPNDPSPAATISSAPVTYKQGGSAAADEQAPKKPINPALQFQPIRRPQVKQPKAKSAAFPKAIIPKTIITTAPAAAAAATAAAAPGAPQPVPHQSTLADWAATEEDEWMYGVGEKRQRGGRRKKKKRQEEQFETDWDEMYDPSRPTNVDEFLRSDEKVEEVREWKSLLYRHRKRQEESDMSDSEDEGAARAAPPPSKPAHSAIVRNQSNRINLHRRSVRAARLLFLCAASKIAPSRAAPRRVCRRRLCPPSGPLNSTTYTFRTTTSSTSSSSSRDNPSGALRLRYNIQSPRPLHASHRKR